MGRPAKSAAIMAKHLTKKEKAARLNAEQNLKSGIPAPPEFLTKSQRKIFRAIIRDLNAADVLGKIDVYVLTTAAIAIDRLRDIERLINDDTETRLLDKKLLDAKKQYTSDFFRCCNELCLSPQSRAKLGKLRFDAEAEKQDPLLKMLSEAAEAETEEAE